MSNPHPREHSANLIVLQDLIQEQKAEIERLRSALPDLSHVIDWLKNGCDPLNAASELEIYQRRIRRALEAKDE